MSQAPTLHCNRRLLIYHHCLQADTRRRIAELTLSLLTGRAWQSTYLLLRETTSTSTLTWLMLLPGFCLHPCFRNAPSVVNVNAIVFVTAKISCYGAKKLQPLLKTAKSTPVRNPRMNC